MNDRTYTNLDGSVECITLFDFHDPHGEVEPAPVRVLLRWDPADPVAVSAEFQGGGFQGWTNTWLFSRDLLAAGILMPVGCGDVRVLPAIYGQLRVVLDSPSGHADFSVDAATVREFLDVTLEHCPAGSEFDLSDIEVELEHLLLAEGM